MDLNDEDEQNRLSKLANHVKPLRYEAGTPHLTDTSTEKGFRPNLFSERPGFARLVRSKG